MVTAQGFEGKHDLDLVEADVNQSNQGLGVASEASPYHNLENEVDFRKTGNDEASETLTITLQHGQVAFGAKIAFAKMFGGELEEGVAEFYRDGMPDPVWTQYFTSDKASGNYATNFQVEDGGFDTIVLKAVDNGKGTEDNDNSDFTVSSIEFTGTTGVPIGYAKSSLDVNYGADGPGSLMLNGLESDVALKDGSSITTDIKDNSIVVRDGGGDLVFQLQLTPATGQWEFFQYQQLASSDVAFNFKATDADGDSVDGSFSLLAMANNAPESTDDEVTAKAGEGLVLTKDDFGDFSDPDSGDQLEKVRIDSLPDANQGTLTLNEESVEVGDVISIGDINYDKLIYTQTNDTAEETAFDFSVSDGAAWSEGTYSLTVKADALPVGSDEEQTLDFEAIAPEPVNTNIVVTLDVSTSMVDADYGGLITLPNGDQKTRLQLAKDALKNMIESYDKQGDVMVKLVTFASDASDLGWYNAKDAIIKIGNLEAGGLTNYEEAIRITTDGYTDSLSGAQTVAYFISDGEPTREISNDGDNSLLSNWAKEDWEDFVASNVVKDGLFVVALGAGISNTHYLEQLASAGNNVSKILIVKDETELMEAIDPVRLTVEGDLKDNVTGGDGNITFDSIKIGSNTYTAADFAEGKTFAIEGKGSLNVDFANGTYTYTAVASEFSDDEDLAFTVKVSDADGDTAEFNVNLGVTSGTFVDGVVEGAMYTTSSGLTGTTNASGAFSYREGDTVTFMVGDVVVGSATPEDLAAGKVFLQDLADVERTDLNDEYVENMAVFLQSLDADSNAYNGITITAAMHAAFEGSTLDLNSVSESECLKALAAITLTKKTPCSTFAICWRNMRASLSLRSMQMTPSKQLFWLMKR